MHELYRVLSAISADTFSQHFRTYFIIPCNPMIYKHLKLLLRPEWNADIRTVLTRQGLNIQKKDIHRMSLFYIFECTRRGANPRPQPWQGCTPPTEPLAHNQIGVTGLEPATSWSQTRRSSQAEPHPVSNYSTYPQNHTLKIYSSVTTYNHGDTHRPSVYFAAP